MTPRRSLTLRSSCLLVVLVSALVVLGGANTAFALAPEVPHWKLESHSAPTNLPLKGEAMIVAVAANLGDKEVNAGIGGTPVTLTDTLPAGIEVTEVKSQSNGTPHGKHSFPCPQEGQKITCTFTETLPPFEQLEVLIRVKTNFSAPGEPENELTITGGGAPTEAKLRRPLRVNNQPTTFGVENSEVSPENEEFGYAGGAGSHPFQLTTTLTFNQTYEKDPEAPPLWPSAPALIRNLNVKLPPGLVGNANVVGKPGLPQQCPDVAFGSNATLQTNACPENTAIGIASVQVNAWITLAYD